MDNSLGNLVQSNSVQTAINAGINEILKDTAAYRFPNSHQILHEFIQTRRNRYYQNNSKGMNISGN